VAFAALALPAALALAGCSGSNNNNASPSPDDTSDAGGGSPGDNTWPVGPDSSTDTPDGGTDEDGGGGDDGGGGTDGSRPDEACKGDSITRSGTVDYDVRSVQIAGAVTLNGAPLPSAVSPGQLVFVEKRTSSRVEIPVRTSSGRYTLTLTPGEYDVLYAPGSTSCGNSDIGAYPCNGGVLKANVALRASGSLDIDIPTVRVEGKATLNGSQFPSTSDRTTLVFRNASRRGAEATVALGGARGAGTYALTVLPGTHDIVFGGASCSTLTTSALPCNGGIVRRGVSITASGTVDVDIPAVRVDIRPTLNGSALPSVANGRGWLSLQREGVRTRFPLGTTNANVGGATLIPGTYTIGYDANESACSSASASPMPCNSGVLRENAAITASGTLDVDIPAVRIDGRATINGSAMPSASVNRGTLSFTRKGGEAYNGTSLGMSGTAAFGVTVLPGTYDIAYEPNESACRSRSIPGTFPCVAGVVRSNVALTASGPLDVDVPAVRIDGRVTLNGSVLPDSFNGRGAVVFSRRGVRAAVPSLPTSGQATYSVTLLPGSYDVGYEGVPSLCNAGGNASPIPCNSGTLRPGVTLDTSGSLDLDIPSIRIEGKVTLNGSVMPDVNGSNRGALSFRMPGEPAFTTRRFDAFGQASYGATLLKGNYIVQYDGNADLCGGGDSPAAPCSSSILAGCPK
jgi:hypothetical protein